jgi:hypothetical protein
MTLLRPCCGTFLLLLASCGETQDSALPQLTAKGYALSAAEYHRAGVAGDVSALALFLQSGVMVDVPDEAGATALMLAAEAGKENAVAFLLDHAAGLKQRDLQQADVGMYATRGGSARVLRLILEKGYVVEPGHGLLGAACRSKHHEVMQVLLPLCQEEKQAALLAAAAAGADAQIEILLKDGASLVDRGPSALAIAAAAGHESTVRLLLRSGGDRFQMDQAGALPLDVAAGHEAVVRLLSEPPSTEERGAAIVVPLPQAAQLLGKADADGKAHRRLRLRSMRLSTVPWPADGVWLAPWSVTEPKVQEGWPEWMKAKSVILSRDGSVRLCLRELPIHAGEPCVALVMAGKVEEIEAKPGEEGYLDGVDHPPWKLESMSHTQAVFSRSDGQRLIVTAQGATVR